MVQPTVLVTTTWLHQGDAVDAFLREHGLHPVYSTPEDRRARGQDLSDVVHAYDGIIAGTEPFTTHVIESAPRLRVIGRTGIGYDNIAVDAATHRGIAVCPTPGINFHSVAEFTIGLLLSVARRIPQHVADVRAGGWNQTSGRELFGATLGIAGLGAIGRSVAAIGHGLGMTVVAYDPFLEPDRARELGVLAVDFDTLLRSSDFLSLHLPLDSRTHHLLDADAFARLKDGVYLINAARGGVVDEEALADALSSGRVAGAALDTVEDEPLSSTSPLRAFDNVVITPHIGAATIESRARCGAMAARAVVDILEGRMADHVVNPDFALHVLTTSDHPRP